MPAPYFSFLITSHAAPEGSVVAVYVNGMPLGQVVDGSFLPHGFIYPKGEPVLIKLHNLPQPFPFESLAAMKQALHDAIDKIDLPVEEAKL